MADPALLPTDASPLPDEEVVRRVRAGEGALFEILVRRHNRRLYRVARAVLGDDAETEDVMQDAYVRAWEHLGQFEGRSSFATWLTRIALHEAWARARRRRKLVALDGMPERAREEIVSAPTSAENPESGLQAREARALLEQAVDALTPAARAVYVMRRVEGLSTAEAAQALGISEEALRVRLHRAEGHLRSALQERLESARASAFDFGATRCDRVTEAVMRRILGRG